MCRSHHLQSPAIGAIISREYLCGQKLAVAPGKMALHGIARQNRYEIGVSGLRSGLVTGNCKPLARAILASGVPYRSSQVTAGIVRAPCRVLVLQTCCMQPSRAVQLETPSNRADCHVQGVAPWHHLATCPLTHPWVATHPPQPPSPALAHQASPPIPPTHPTRPPAEHPDFGKKKGDTAHHGPGAHYWDHSKGYLSHKPGKQHDGERAHE